MQKIFVSFGLFALLIFLSQVSFAENTKFKQQIVPIDCIYEVIDVGTQKLRYLTPETCPLDPGPPIVTEPSLPEDQPAANDIRWVYNPQVEFSKPPQEQSENPPPQQELAGSIEETSGRNRTNLLGILLISIVATTWWFLLILRRRKKNDDS